MNFWVTEKQTTDCISLYNNAGLICKVSEKIASEMLKIAVLDNLTVVNAHIGNLREYPHQPYTTRNYRHRPTFLPPVVWICLHSNFYGGLRKTHLFCNRVRIGHSRSSKVVDFGTNRKGVCDFLLVINSNFGSILHRFRDTVTYWLKIENFSYLTLI